MVILQNFYRDCSNYQVYCGVVKFLITTSRSKLDSQKLTWCAGETAHVHHHLHHMLL